MNMTVLCMTMLHLDELIDENLRGGVGGGTHPVPPDSFLPLL